MKDLLVLSYYFPPLGLGGTQRIAKFVKYLPQFGWRPTVVTVKPIIYWAMDESLLTDVQGIQIVRTESFDPQRLLARFRPMDGGAQLGVKGGRLDAVNRRLMPLVFQPDVKILWRFHALAAVRRLASQQKFDALLTTSPPHSTHLIGRQAAGRLRLPWLADFRDGWAGSHVVTEPNLIARRRNLRLQKQVVSSADAIVACSEGILKHLLSTLEDLHKGWVITNGYDPEDFVLESDKLSSSFFTLCYCGTLNQWAKPQPFLRALAWAMRQEPLLKNKLKVLFVGLDMTGRLVEEIHALGLQSCVATLGHRPHQEAVAHLCSADALLLLADAKPSDTFIPGKTFEYIGAQKPIFVISNSRQTNDFLREYHRAAIVESQQPEEIGRRLLEFIASPPRISSPDRHFIEQFDRRRQTARLAKILDTICAEKKIGFC